MRCKRQIIRPGIKNAADFSSAAGFLTLGWQLIIDVKVKCIEQGTTQAAVTEQIDTTKSYVNRVIKKPNGVVNNTFVQMMETLGNDIELHYVKREE